jgi:gamma-glutamyl hercynylcysteine S-oxide synthase
MTSNALKTSPLPTDAEQVLVALDAAREATIALVAVLDEEALRRVHSPIMSPLVWDLGHIAAYEDLWLAHRHGGMKLLRPELAELYDAFETPRAIRGEIETLGPAEARAYMDNVRARSVEAISNRGIGDGVACELVIRHELQHSETMRQTLAIADLLPAGEPRLEPMEGPAEWIEIAAGPFAMGANGDRFAYDNERPRHTVEVGAFSIGRSPVSNAAWIQFSDGGGYAREEWWSPAGWAWKQEHDVTHHPAVEAGHPRAPVCHVSWFEADAFARAHGARLPSEAEWEKAATWSAASEEAGTVSEQAGVLHAASQVWEWTQSPFRGYPGFVAHPYREYSEVFFGDGYRVLRGSSWATATRVANRTFRNWDLPQRRQIFAGLRLARDTA